MKAYKWIYKEQKYIEYELPKNATMYEMDLLMIIACASCGKPQLFGDTYTSRVIHNKHGMAYSVCQRCYSKEYEEEKENWERENDRKRL